MSESPNAGTSGRLDVRTFRCPDVLMSGCPDIQTSGRMNVWMTPDVRTSGRPDMRMSGRLDVRTSGHPGFALNLPGDAFTCLSLPLLDAGGLREPWLLATDTFSAETAPAAATGDMVNDGNLLSDKTFES